MYKHNIQRNKRAYTLVELVIYLALFTILSLVLSNITISGYKAYKTVRVNRDITEQSSLAMEYITRTIRSASDASSSSTFDTSPGVLILSNSSSTTTFNLSSGVLRISETTAGGTTVGNITGGNISVSYLMFEKIVTAKSQAIKTILTLTQSATGKSETFYMTTILRDSY